MRGKFITVEGIEGVGKSTVVPYIKSLIEDAGFPVYLTREPGGTELAEAIRQILLSEWKEELLPQTELLLMFASRSQHTRVVIEPNLKAGNWVVCERFTDASMAYQGGGRNIPSDYIESLAKLVHEETWPDLTLYLDLDVKGSVSRTRERVKDRIEQEGWEFFNRVRSVYLDLASQESRIVAIDASQSLENVQAAIASTVSPFLQ
ncbi:MAG: dTMP kinase [Gammaproteobacteria bacterium]|nr:dTMP kinase [Gammaproteobacteria bacterium]